MESISKMNFFISRFEIYREEMEQDENQKVCGLIAVNTVDRKISFKLLSGATIDIYLMLAVMSLDTHWLKIIEEIKDTIDISEYIILNTGYIYDSDELYIARKNDNGLPVIISQVINGRNTMFGIHECTLSPVDYLKFINQYSHFFERTPKDMCAKLRNLYQFRYLK